MKVPLEELGITLLLVLGFAAVGETVLWRRSRNLFAWNESFLVGMGVLAAALFPLSLFWPRHALIAVLALMGLAGIAEAVRLVRGKAAPSPEPPSLPADRGWLTRALSTGAIVVALLFCALNFRRTYLWDGFQIWATKAQLLSHQGGLPRAWFPGDDYDSRLLTYPSLVPLFEALLSRVRGGFDFDVLKPIFLPFFLSMLLSTYGAVRSVSSARAASFATLLLALLPLSSTQYATGGYADMPQAAVVAAVVRAGLRRGSKESRWRSPLPWLIGALTTVKAEGSILAVVACLAVLIAWSFDDHRRLLPGLRSHWSGAAVILAFVAVRRSYLGWLGVEDTSFSPVDTRHLSLVPALLRPVASLSLRWMLNPVQWGLFWPAFAACALVLFARGSNPERSLAVTTAMGVIAYAAIFLFTTWQLDLHVAQAYPRLLSQLAPAATVVIVLGWIRGRPPSDDAG